MGTADIVLRNVTKRFGTVTAVQRVSLEVRRGEFLALLGPSGCGKTTLLNLIAGFAEADEGEIYIRDRLMTHVEPFRRDVGMVFQNYALFPHMTVRGNVSFGLEMRSLAKAERALRIQEALELVKLGGLADRYPHQLSGGQQQRVALARVLTIRPSVLLLDEPLGALDRQLREEMQVELRQLQQRLGITTIFVTHDQEEALTMADRVALVNLGVIEQIGSPDELYERPKTEFVATFIGVSNIFEGVACERPDSQCLIQDPQGAWLTARGDCEPGTRVKIVIRPEKIRLAERATSDSVNGLQGQIQNVIYVGTHSRYFVILPTGQRVVVYEQSLPDQPRRTRRAGDEVSLSWDPKNAFVIREGGR